jgi:hypothetical protein
VTDYAKLREVSEAMNAAVGSPDHCKFEMLRMDFRNVTEPDTILALLDEMDSLRKSRAEALLDAERAREERNREHVRLNAEWMAKCEELRKDAQMVYQVKYESGGWIDHDKEKTEWFARMGYETRVLILVAKKEGA